MIEAFFDRDGEDAHRKFQRWRARHWNEGLFLNVRSPADVMLHRSPCPHLGDTDWARDEHGWGSLTRSMKVCSTSRRKLERWASENATVTLKRCQHCERLADEKQMWSVASPIKRSPNENIPKIGRTIGDFWAWAFSDVLTNVDRATLAEYIVATALGIDDKPRPGSWEAYDLDYRDAKVEVKSTSLVQSWKSEKKSKPQFTIKAAGRWDEATGKWLHVAPERAADIYVFCVFDPREEGSPDPLDVSEWFFLVVSTKRIAEAYGDQKSVRLSRVQEIEDVTRYWELRERVDLELREGT
jgi:hypothetical protein